MPNLDLKFEVTEPFPAYAWPLAYAWWEHSFNMAGHDFSPKTPDAFVEFCVRSYRRSFAVWKDGRIGGVIAFEIPDPPLAIAHLLFAPRMARTHTAPALHEACKRLFASSECIKVMGLIPAHNRLAIALVVRAGGKVEGLLESFSTMGGKPLDVVAVGVTKENFDGIESRRIERAVESANQLHGHADVQPVADTPAIGPGEHLVELVERSLLGGSLAERAEHGDPGSQPDQRNVRADRKHAKQKPGVKGLRKKRSDGRRGALDGAGKAKQPRDKRK